MEYLIARDGVSSQHGVAYDYVLGGDGLYLHTQNRFLEVRVPVAGATVRGLSPIYSSFELKTGRLPHVLWQHIVTVAQAWAARGHEVMLAVTHEDGAGYQLYVPRQATSATRVIYERRDRTVLEIHSHHRFRAQFSAVDDADEQRLCLYGVIGCLDGETPEVALRVGAYGSYLPVSWESVFTGEKRPYRDLVGEPEEAEDDLQD